MYDPQEIRMQRWFAIPAERDHIGLNTLLQFGLQSPELISLIRERIDMLGKQIAADPDYRAFADAQQEVTKLMQEINSEISFQVFGERPCTHDCSSCHADCASKGHSHDD